MRCALINKPEIVAPTELMAFPQRKSKLNKPAKIVLLGGWRVTGVCCCVSCARLGGDAGSWPSAIGALGRGVVGSGGLRGGISGMTDFIMSTEVVSIALRIAKRLLGKTSIMIAQSDGRIESTGFFRLLSYVVLRIELVRYLRLDLEPSLPGAIPSSPVF